MLIISGFLSIVVVSWQAPWQEGHAPGQNTAPWVSGSRAEARTNFFRDLNTENETDYVPEERPSSRINPKEMIVDRRAEFEDYAAIEREQSVIDMPKGAMTKKSEDKDISELPWNEHRKSFPREAFTKDLLWPVREGKLTSGFGIRGGKLHEGLDITSKLGSPIRAIGRGRIVFNGTIRGYGNTVVVYHGNGVSSVYAHNFKNFKSVGDEVERGEVLAAVGKTGHARAPHVHLELRRDGSPVNPLQYDFEGSPMSTPVR